MTWAREGGASSLALLQGVYFAGTGVWSLVDVRSFQAVTGPKTDIWLVKTVGALVTSIGATLIAAARGRRVTRETGILAATSAAALAMVDVYYVARGRIAKVYLADALAELALLGAWAIAARAR